MVQLLAVPVQSGPLFWPVLVTGLSSTKPERSSSLSMVVDIWLYSGNGGNMVLVVEAAVVVLVGGNSIGGGGGRRGLREFFFVQSHLISPSRNHMIMLILLIGESSSPTILLLLPPRAGPSSRPMLANYYLQLHYVLGNDNAMPHHLYQPGTMDDTWRWHRYIIFFFSMN